jgi:hypothetical protein
MYRLYKPRPYRIIVAATGQRTVGRGKWQRTQTIGYAVVAWNGDDEARKLFDPGRLPGAGTFCWPGLTAARRAALAQFADPTVHQVQVRTNQDRPVYLWNRHSDGRISGYRPEWEW